MGKVEVALARAGGYVEREGIGSTEGYTAAREQK
jgi:hypothetical protein